MNKHFCRCAFLAFAGLLALLLGGCQKEAPLRTDFSMGENARVGKMTYSVVESAWRTQLGEGFKVRSPEQRFLLIKISVTNGSGKDVSIPLLTLEGNSGQTYREIADGEGVDNWFGLLRTLNTGETQQGNVLFDVPLTSYKLRVPDINDSGFERYASIQIPLRIDSNVPVQAPINPDILK
jgi:hypothetical protein